MHQTVGFRADVYEEPVVDHLLREENQRLKKEDEKGGLSPRQLVPRRPALEYVQGLPTLTILYAQAADKRRRLRAEINSIKVRSS